MRGSVALPLLFRHLGREAGIPDEVAFAAKGEVKRIIAQTRSRVLEGKKVASADKVLSLFEPHTRAIPRHKGGVEAEFGRHVILDEVEGGIVTRYQIWSIPTSMDRRWKP